MAQTGGDKALTARSPEPVLRRSRPRTADPELVWEVKRNIADRDLLHAAGLPVKLQFSHRASIGIEPSVSKLIAADNREAMALMLAGSESSASLAGTVKLCYMDPPYNTGAHFSTYSDKVGSAGWLETLRDRLVQIRALLTADGSVWLHLDDSEQHHARSVLDEVFGRDAFVATVIWQKRTSRDNRTAFSSSHDYIHVYAPQGAKVWKRIRNGLPDTGTFSNPDNDPRGPWRSTPMSAQAGHATKAQYYTVTTPTGATHEPPPGRCWTYSEPRLRELDADGRVYWPRNGHGRPRLKRYEYEVLGLAPSTLWMADFAGDTAEAKRELLGVFPEGSPFDTPKPERLMERIISIATNPGDLVLDPYLGSGTTAVAALRAGRHFIGIEQAKDVVLNIAIPRIASRTEHLNVGLDVLEVVPAPLSRGRTSRPSR